MRSLEKKGMLMKAVHLGIPWLMGTLVTGGEVTDSISGDLLHNPFER
jgi:hypothetical protein